MSLSCKTSDIGTLPLPLFLLLCLVLLRTKATTTDFDFGTLTLSSLKLLGDAHLNNGNVRLTRDLAVPNSGAGKVLYSKPIRFRQPSTHAITSFSTFFSFSVTNLNPSSIGGGLAFVLSPDSDTLGAAGGFLGLLNTNDMPKAASSFVAVEFDTLMDVEFKDINGNHVGLDLSSMVSTQIGDLGAINIDLKSGDLVNAWIDYDGTSLSFNISVSYSNLKPKEPILSFNLDLDQYVNDFMYVGFSGSTQGSTEVHSIEWWSFSSSFQLSSGSEPSSSVPPPPTASLMNPTANSVKSPPPTLAPSGLESVGGKSVKSDSCHNQLCKQGAGAVAGVVTASAFFVIFAGVLIWVFSKRSKRVKEAKPTMSFSTSHLLLSLQDSVSDCNGMITICTSSSENSFIGGGHDLV
uniref:L-type lectin-domain containing receptor kinase VIII.1-like n=1 Tax=Populus alba TaxID=43335 RepID=A0A4U5M9W0_POPAL|nr:L-type lectin-domain containing receptor kinase VIII.1-like [Populus alba]